MNGRDDGAYLYGRRRYEVMAAWQTLPTRDQPILHGGLREHMAGCREGPLQSFSGRVRAQSLRRANGTNDDLANSD